MSKVNVPTGTYKAIPVECTLKISEKKKTPYAEIMFKVVDKPEYFYVKYNGYLTEKTEKRTLQSLIYCGFKGDSLSGLNINLLDRNAEVEIVVSNTTMDDGKVYSKVDWVNEVKASKGTATQVKLQDDHIKDLFKELRGDVKSGEDVPPPDFGEEPLPF